MKKVLAIILIFLLLLLLVSCSSSKSSTLTCSMCGKTYKAGDSGGNYMSIAYSGMCKKCHNNYDYARKALGK